MRMAAAGLRRLQTICITFSTDCVRVCLCVICRWKIFRRRRRR